MCDDKTIVTLRASRVDSAGHLRPVRGVHVRAVFIHQRHEIEVGQRGQFWRDPCKSLWILGRSQDTALVALHTDGSTGVDKANLWLSFAGHKASEAIEPELQKRSLRLAV